MTRTNAAWKLKKIHETMENIARMNKKYKNKEINEDQCRDQLTHDLEYITTIASPDQPKLQEPGHMEKMYTVNKAEIIENLRENHFLLKEIPILEWDEASINLFSEQLNDTGLLLRQIEDRLAVTKQIETLYKVRESLELAIKSGSWGGEILKGFKGDLQRIEDKIENIKSCGIYRMMIAEKVKVKS